MEGLVKKRWDELFQAKGEEKKSSAIGQGSVAIVADRGHGGRRASSGGPWGGILCSGTPLIGASMDSQRTGKPGAAGEAGMLALQHDRQGKCRLLQELPTPIQAFDRSADHHLSAPSRLPALLHAVSYCLCFRNLFLRWSSRIKPSARLGSRHARTTDHTGCYPSREQCGWIASVEEGVSRAVGETRTGTSGTYIIIGGMLGASELYHREPARGSSALDANHQQ